MQKFLIRSHERGIKDIGWLLSQFVLSFSTYQNPTKAGFGLLRVLNDDWVDVGGGFGLHPHTNMEIISVMLQGKMNHKDSMGFSEVVEADWVQIMSAGSGLRHEEYNVGDEKVRFLQIWIEPKLQNITPRYQKRHFPKENRKNQLKTIVSQEEGTAHCWINQNAKLSLGYYEASQTIDYSFNSTNKAVFLYLIAGKITIADEILTPEDGIGIWQTNSIKIEILEESDFVLIEIPINH